MVKRRVHFFIASIVLCCIGSTIFPRTWLVPPAQTRQYLLFPPCRCTTEVVCEKVDNVSKPKKPKRRYFSDIDYNDEDYDYHDGPRKQWQQECEQIVKTVIKENTVCFDVWIKVLGAMADKPTGCGTLSRLLFAQSSFKLKDAFENSEAALASNPFVSLATITPDPEFSGVGFVLGENLAIKLTSCCHIGMRAHLPFKTVQVKPKSSLSDFIKGGTLAELRRIQREPVGPDGTPPIIEDSFAYRLDLLSSLFQNGINGDKFIRYDLVNLTIDQDDVTDNNGSPIHLVGRSDGTFPPSPFSATVATVAAAPFVNGQGNNVANNQRARFQQGVSYASLGNNATQQSELYVVPTLNAAGDGLSVDAQHIMTDAENILGRTGVSSLQSFLDEKNISFASQRKSGIGDLDLEFFINCDASPCLWFEGRLGLVLPTGAKVDNPGQLFLQPLGNNGHVEWNLGLASGWDLSRCIKLYADFSYNWVLSATECIAGSFKGATVKNIGPVTKANISWNYLLFHANAILMYPSSERFGLNVRYQYYYKQKDSINFCVTSIKDLAGETKTLDPTILQKFTNVHANQIGADIFSVFDYCTLWGGISYVVGGKNAPQEFIWNVGLDINF
ncbi:hypothetical protein A3F06_00040 [candidate division TM6 bacterium RIFCSPHIGHO2_12_FULL_36_22]|nr:MAG: hypothetical protein A3F06_00040 [candidate division TM6 bacterium RIFCSPHIGHO2_12_FULL_36_22]